MATRIEPTSATGFELQLQDAVLRPGRLSGQEITFLDAPEDDCIAVYELWVAGESVSVDGACAADPDAYLECVLAADADQRHPQ